MTSSGSPDGALLTGEELKQAFCDAGWIDAKGSWYNNCLKPGNGDMGLDDPSHCLVRLKEPQASPTVEAGKFSHPLAAEMQFFFGCKPSDPSKLPPPPRVLGRSWDDLADD